MTCSITIIDSKANNSDHDSHDSDDKGHYQNS